MGSYLSKEQTGDTTFNKKRPRDETSASDFKRQKSGKGSRQKASIHQDWTPDPNREPSNEPRFPKKKVALLFGYNGSGYQGLQFNPGAISIEGVLFEALCKARAISKDNADDPKKVQWSRAARTDKGVHAAGNVIGLKLAFPPDEEDIVEKINSYLPEQIRVWGLVRTIRQFGAKTLCDSRTYEYILPTHVFMPPRKKKPTKMPTCEDDVKVFERNDADPRYVPRSNTEELSKMNGYRIDSATLAKFRQAMEMFEGTHNFHNYTIGRKPSDKSCQRYMISITVDTPMYIDGVEWLSVKLHGQSFMLHQIRKMISMAVLVVRTKTPMELISKTFELTKINIPKAPATGLLLERPTFEAYQNKPAKSSSEPPREAIDFDIYKEKIQNFKNTQIYSKIYESEMRERGFEGFLLSIDCSTSHDFSYLNPEGVIPVEAIVHSKYTSQEASEEPDEQPDDDN